MRGMEGSRVARWMDFLTGAEAGSQVDTLPCDQCGSILQGLQHLTGLASGGELNEALPGGRQHQHRHHSTELTTQLTQIPLSSRDRQLMEVKDRRGRTAL